MHKFFLSLISIVLLCGCSWFGIGDDSSTTAASTVPEETVAASDTASEQTVAEAKPAPAKKTATRGKKSEEQIKQELDQMGRKLAAQSSRTLLPNKANKSVKQVGGHWVASYIDVRPDEVVTQLRAGNNGQYVGSIRYAEHFMECTGSTRAAALSETAQCREVRRKNLNELIRYDGNQWQD